jgi:hypothetical protein
VSLCPSEHICPVQIASKQCSELLGSIWGFAGSSTVEEQLDFGAIGHQERLALSSKPKHPPQSTCRDPPQRPHRSGAHPRHWMTSLLPRYLNDTLSSPSPPLLLASRTAFALPRAQQTGERVFGTPDSSETSCVRIAYAHYYGYAANSIQSPALWPAPRSAYLLWPAAPPRLRTPPDARPPARGRRPPGGWWTVAGFICALALLLIPEQSMWSDERPW